MLIFHDRMGMLTNPYAWGFVLIWLVTMIACVTLWARESRLGKTSGTLECSLFWLLGLAMLLFAVFRPLGIARDDMPYLDFFKGICPTITCGDLLQGSRDVGWYSAVGILKSFVPDPRVMLWLSAAGLLVKLAVIYSLVKRPLFSLFFYLSLYYQLQDLTAWRVSLALAMFMTAIWLVVRTQNYWSALILFICGFFHKQAFLAPLILIGLFLRRRQFLLISICLILTGLLALGIYPMLHLIAAKLWESSKVKDVMVNQGLGLYVLARLAGAYTGFRQAPILVYPLIMLTLWLLVKARPDNEKLDVMLIGCVVISCTFLWGFASLPGAQVRLFEFFMVPTVLLAGVRRLNRLELLGLIVISGLYVAKYNIVHQLIGESWPS